MYMVNFYGAGGGSHKKDFYPKVGRSHKKLLEYSVRVSVRE
jgi:hypothetical protein